MQLQSQGIRHELDITLENLNINQFIPHGLLINDLITNSLKYAFPVSKEENCIMPSTYPERQNIKVSYMDNGVDSLLNQLEAEYEKELENGFKLQFCFKTRLKQKKEPAF